MQGPSRVWRALLPGCAALVLATGLAACDTLSFAAANVPAYFAGSARTAGIAYARGARGRLDVYRPQSTRTAGALPVIVFFYGGSWTSGRRIDYRFAATALSELGFVVVVPDYRLYPEVRFPAFVDDGAAAVAWTQQHVRDYGGDPGRIVLAGHSAGAYIAALLAVDDAYLRRAGADPAAITGLITLSGPMHLRPNTATLNTIFGAPYGAPDWQVTARVSRPVPQALLLHGRDDQLVGVDNSELFAERLRQQGSAVTLKVYDHCDHVCTLAALSVPGRHRAPVLADVTAFLRGLPLRGSGTATAAAGGHLN